MANLHALAKVIEARDSYASGHATRVTEIADIVAVRLGWDEERREVLRLAGALHDIGKLTVPEEVLNKPGSLTEEERAQVREHPRAGAAMVWAITPLRGAIPGVLYHHEHWDGSGYPTGRSGEEIPPEARLLAIADSFDAMTNDRPYRAALPAKRALDEIERCAGSQFDPGIARAFVEAWEAGAFGVTAALRAAAS